MLDQLNRMSAMSSLLRDRAIDKQANVVGKAIGSGLNLVGRAASATGKIMKLPVTLAENVGGAVGKRVIGPALSAAGSAVGTVASNTAKNVWNKPSNLFKAVGGVMTGAHLLGSTRSNQAQFDWASNPASGDMAANQALQNVYGQ